MELPRSSQSGSGNCGDFAPEMAETLQFTEEILSLMAETDLQQQSFDSPPENGSSFTALLELPTNQAIELLHEPGTVNRQAIGSAGSWRDPPADQKQVAFSSFNCSPTFPSNAALVERAARFSIFAAKVSAAAQTSSDPSNGREISSVKLKAEPADSDPCLNSSPNFASTAAKQRSGKRKGVENSKVKAPAKRSKNVEDGSSKTGEEIKGSEKLPYVHVRSRRGQATDSHSLAERARREKINARMKLLQELVPGCNKISGTALVLDEIINHVQSLQRQVEFLSMRLAAVNPRIDFRSLNSFFTTDNGDLATGDLASMVAMDPLLWSQLLVDGAGRHQQQFWHSDLSSWQRDDNNAFITPESRLLDYNSTDSGKESMYFFYISIIIHKLCILIPSSFLYKQVFTCYLILLTWEFVKWHKAWVCSPSKPAPNLPGVCVSVCLVGATRGKSLVGSLTSGISRSSQKSTKKKKKKTLLFVS